MMRVQLVLCMLVLSCAACATMPLAKQNLLANGGFETRQPKDQTRPADWVQDGIGPIYKLDAAHAKDGRRAMLISFKDGMNENGYAGLMQTLDVRNFAGKTLMFSAYLRRTSGKSKTGIWALVSDAAKTKLSYQNSYDQTVPTGKIWSRHQLILDLPPTAQTLKLGMSIHEADGEFWIDDAQLMFQ
jgi:hypothetical protein